MILSGAEIEKYCYCEGRRYVSGERLFLNASGASVKGLFRGETLIIDLHAEPVLPERNAYIRLTVDGRSRRIRLPKKEKRFTLSFPRGTALPEAASLPSIVPRGRLPETISSLPFSAFMPTSITRFTAVH